MENEEFQMIFINHLKDFSSFRAETETHHDYMASAMKKVVEITENLPCKTNIEKITRIEDRHKAFSAAIITILGGIIIYLAGNGITHFFQHVR